MAEFRGFRFPFQEIRGEVPASAVPPQLLADSIKQILLTEKGERVMRPDFGTRLRRMLFEGINRDFVTRIQKEILEAIVRWEPRVEVTKIHVVQGEDQFDSRVTVNVEFVALGKKTETGPVLIGPA
jgi:hypothetical protein